MKRPRRRTVVIFVLFAVLGTVTGLFTWHRSTFESRNRILISHETTYLDGPLTEDGYVDYLEAVNEKLSDGVTPESNAAIPLWRAMGPNFDSYGGPPPTRELCDRFGIDSLDEDEHLVSIKEFAECESERLPLDALTENYFRQVQIREDFFHILRWEQHVAGERPWSAQEYPRVFGWLKQNARPLEHAVSASGRTRFYSPVLHRRDADDYPTLISVCFSETEGIDRICGMLKARAMLSIRSEQLESAWNDLVTSHRLARLVSRGPWQNHALTAGVTEWRTCDAYLVLLAHETLTADQIHRFRRDLEALPALPPLVHPLHYDRLMWIDCATKVSSQTHDQQRETLLRDLPDALAGNTINWNEVLRTLNIVMDQFIDAATTESYIGVLAKWEKVTKSLDERIEGLEKGDATELITAELLRSLVYSREWPAYYLRRNVRMQMTKFAFVLAEFKAAKGEFPESLDELVPNYTLELPIDPFSKGVPFGYQRREDGFRLFSVGVNQEDDDGRAYRDKPRGDDIVIVFPPEYEQLPRPDVDPESVRIYAETANRKPNNSLENPARNDLKDAGR